MPVIISPTCIQPSVPLSERSSIYDAAPPIGAVQDREVLVTVGLAVVKFVGELGSVVILVTEVGAEVPDILTAETL